MIEFEVATGSFLGREHLWTGKGLRKTLIGRPNQDACYHLPLDNMEIAVVCDGCGEGIHSEVGSQIGSRLIVEAIKNNYERFLLGHTSLGLDRPDAFMERVRLDVLAQIRVLANSMGPSISNVIGDYFLFTTVGVIITEATTIFFHLGDGYFAMNEALIELGPFPNNMPAYIGYGITGSSLTTEHPNLLRFTVQEPLRTALIDSVMLASDGIRFLEGKEDENIPGLDKKVGPIRQFWWDDIYFSNPYALARQLSLLGRDYIKPKWEEKRVESSPGLLLDDTTIVSLRNCRERARLSSEDTELREWVKNVKRI